MLVQIELVILYTLVCFGVWIFVLYKLEPTTINLKYPDDIDLYLIMSIGLHTLLIGFTAPVLMFFGFVYYLGKLVVYLSQCLANRNT